MIAQPALDLTSPSTQHAPHPFNQSSADVILRTPDRIHFYVHSPILSQASPIFSDMFSLPQPQGPMQASETRPIVDVTEDSKTLERLLHLCYPIKKPELGELADITPVLNAAIKYEMEWPILLLTRDLLAVVSRHPLSVWAVACRSGLEDVARKAANEISGRANTLSDPLTTPLDILQTMIQEQGTVALDGVCAGDYYRLREFLRLGVSRPLYKRLYADQVEPRDERLSLPTPDVFVPSDPPPDVALQCPDGTQCRAHHLILSLHSTTLGRLIATARGSLLFDVNVTTAQPPSRIPVIELDIDPQTLTSMLDVCYRGVSHLTYDVSRLGSLIVASRTYGMAQVERLAKERWDEVAASDPLQAFFVAIKYRLHDCAKTAARNLLERPIAGSYSVMMESATALSYHRLLEYYRSCARAVTTALEKAAADVTETIRNTHDPNRYYSRSYCPQTIPNPNTMGEYLRGLARRAADDGPGKNSDIRLPALLAQSCSGKSSWPSCTSTLCHGLVTAFLKLDSDLPQEIVDAIAQVTLEID